MRISFVILVVLTAILSCDSSGLSEDDYSFRIIKIDDDSKLLETKSQKTILSKKPNLVSDKYNKIPIIKIPIEKFMTISTTHMGFINELGCGDKLSGFPNPKYLYESHKNIKNIGSDNFLDVEKVISLNPDVVFVYSSKIFDKYYNVLRKNNIKIVEINEHLEPNPLKRAKWIEFFAEFFDKKEEADSIYHKIKENYNKITKSILDIKDKPKVFSGINYGDFWYISGKKSYVSNLILDAGGDYIYKNSDWKNAKPLSFERVFVQSRDADIWVNSGDFKSLSEMRDLNKKYALFKSFETKNIYNPILKSNENSNDFFERGAVRCDLVLRDLTKIFYPKKNAKTPFCFYKKLK